MSGAADAVEALVRQHNTQDLSEARMLRKIVREIRPFLTDFEFVVLMFIFDRTYTFGKASEVIPVQHFLEGVRTGDGEIIAPRLSCSRRTLYRALEKLIDNVIIITAKKHRTATPSYMINPMWSPDLCHQRHKLVLQVTQASATPKTAYNKKNITYDVQHVAPALTHGAIARSEKVQAKDALMASVAAATTKSHASREKRKGKLNATGLEKIWEDAFREAYPDDTFFKWRVYEQSAFVKAVKRGVPIASIPEFIQFAVANFDNVINDRFAWMKSKPTVNVGFVTKHIAEFFAAFEDDRDPNRKIKRRIREAPIRQPKETSNVDTEKVARLTAENEALKAKLGKTAIDKSRVRKRLIRNRPTTGSEFGSWEG